MAAIKLIKEQLLKIRTISDKVEQLNRSLDELATGRHPTEELTTALQGVPAATAKLVTYQQTLQRQLDFLLSPHLPAAEVASHTTAETIRLGKFYHSQYRVRPQLHAQSMPPTLAIELLAWHRKKSVEETQQEFTTAITSADGKFDQLVKELDYILDTRAGCLAYEKIKRQQAVDEVERQLARDSLSEHERQQLEKELERKKLALHVFLTAAQRSMITAWRMEPITPEEQHQMHRLLEEIKVLRQNTRYKPNYIAQFAPGTCIVDAATAHEELAKKFPDNGVVLSSDSPTSGVPRSEFQEGKAIISVIQLPLTQQKIGWVHEYNASQRRGVTTILPGPPTSRLSQIKPLTAKSTADYLVAALRVLESHRDTYGQLPNKFSGHGGESKTDKTLILAMLFLCEKLGRKVQNETGYQLDNGDRKNFQKAYLLIHEQIRALKPRPPDVPRARPVR